MKKYSYWVFAIAGLIGSACDDDNDETSLHEQDRSFVMNASEANFAEVDLGNLAVMKATTPSVKTFGQMMSTEHQEALDELESIADDKDAETMTSLNAKHQALKARLATMSGYAFDTAYMHSQVKDHQATESLFQQEISSGMDQQVKAYASKYLPHIQMHLHKADSITSTLKP